MRGSFFSILRRSTVLPSENENQCSTDDLTKQVVKVVKEKDCGSVSSRASTLLVSDAQDESCASIPAKRSSVEQAVALRRQLSEFLEADERVRLESLSGGTLRVEPLGNAVSGGLMSYWHRRWQISRPAKSSTQSPHNTDNSESKNNRAPKAATQAPPSAVIPANCSTKPARAEARAPLDLDAAYLLALQSTSEEETTTQPCLHPTEPLNVCDTSAHGSNTAAVPAATPQLERVTSSSNVHAPQSRPTSARPTSARPVLGRTNSGRPTSARPTMRSSFMRVMKGTNFRMNSIKRMSGLGA